MSAYTRLLDLLDGWGSEADDCGYDDEIAETISNLTKTAYDRKTMTDMEVKLFLLQKVYPLLIGD